MLATVCNTTQVSFDPQPIDAHIHGPSMAWVLSHALARADVDETHAIFGQARILLKEGDITDAEGAGVTNTRRAIDITIKVGFCTRAHYFHTLNQKMDLFILIWMIYPDFFIEETLFSQ